MINRSIFFISNKRFDNRLYSIWYGMLHRCYRKSNNSYELYGKRGIRVCDEWINDFWSFYHWSKKNGYKKNLTIDRINPDENYGPTNCKWSTVTEQNSHLSNLVYTPDLDGKYDTVRSLSKKYNIPKNSLNNLSWKLRKNIYTEQQYFNSFKKLINKYKEK